MICSIFFTTNQDPLENRVPPVHMLVGPDCVDKVKNEKLAFELKTDSKDNMVSDFAKWPCWTKTTFVQYEGEDRQLFKVNETLNAKTSVCRWVVSGFS